MEKRLLVAILLSFLVLYVYQVLVLKPAQDKAKREAPAGATTAATGGPSAGQAAGTATAVTAAAGQAGAETAAAASPSQPIVADASEHDIVVETQTVRAVFTNRGAKLKSWKLKKFLDLQKHPQELVPSYLQPGRIHPFDLMVDDAKATDRLKYALYRVSGPQSGTIDATKNGQTIVFEFSDGFGLRARKIFTFEPTGYVVRVTAEVQVGDRKMNPTVLWGAGLGDQVPGAESSRYILKPEAIILRGSKVQRIAATDLYKQPVQEGDFSAAGVDDQYFIAMALPKRTARVDYSRVVFTEPTPEAADGAKAKAAPKLADLVAFGIRQARSMDDLQFFFGPKDFDVLKAARPDLQLVRVINFGIFDFLAVPLLRALVWIHGYIGNFGWSIIVLTFLINAVMFPLRHKSMVSMRKMQEIQPQVKAIQDRYKHLKATDPERQKMNSEMMSLYKEKGVNPASGCVPMLHTMPVLFAFYSLLSAAIELRGEPFIWWITDLSAHDPYYVTPILMGVSQLWQQKMTPTGGDPAQQKMMMMMPLVFTFMFLWMPSGLTIYWFFSNLMAIGQQYITNGLVGPPSVPRPPAERKLKVKTA